MNIKNRLLILSLLPNEGDFLTMTVKKDIANKVSVNQDEISALNMKVDAGSVTWDKTMEEEKHIEFTDMELDMIKDSLDTLDREKKLNDDTFELYKIINELLQNRQ